MAMFGRSGYAPFNDRTAEEVDSFGFTGVVFTRPVPARFPGHDEILFGVECKNTSYRKNLLREILGVRRELSLLADDQQTGFRAWPRALVPARPSSCLSVFSTDDGITRLRHSPDVFGIDFEHLDM